MKKFLIATTALVATAGIANAEVAVSGNGRMGIVYNGDSLNFSSRIRVAFTLSGETDGGLQFGGSFRADNAGGAASGTSGSIYVSSSTSKLAMGDVAGAAEVAVGDLPEVGFQDVGDNDVRYITGDNGGNVVVNATGTAMPVGPHALYTYSAGALSLAVSMGDGQNGTSNTTQEYAVGVKYSMDAYSVSLGYEVSDPVIGNSAKHLIVGGSANFADTTVNVFYGDGSGAINTFSQYGIGVSSKFDAMTIKGFVRQDKNGSLVGLPTGTKVLNWGLGGEYSLGGGASIAGGIADNDLPGTNAKADIGLKFTF